MHSKIINYHTERQYCRVANRVGLNPVCKWGDESCPEGELAAEMLEMMEIKQAVLGTESALLEGNGITNKTSVKKMS